MFSIFILIALFITAHSFSYSSNCNKAIQLRTSVNGKSNIFPTSYVKKTQSMQMNFFDDAFRFFSNMKKEASAKHILIKGPDGSKKLQILKDELASATDISSAFSELASKVSECPSASRGGNLGTFKPGMMVKEFDKVVFQEEVGKVHGPIETQFGSHLILITRRYEGEEKK